MKIKKLQIHTKKLSFDIEYLTFQNGMIIRNVEAYLTDCDIQDMVKGMLKREKRAFLKALNEVKP